MRSRPQVAGLCCWKTPPIRSNDAVYEMVVLLDKNQDMLTELTEAHRSTPAVLSVPSKTHGSGLATVMVMLRLFGVQQVRATTSDGRTPVDRVAMLRRSPGKGSDCRS
jgi:ribulose 1,5-bisphosphate carboxylase large subunit-like protein